MKYTINKKSISIILIFIICFLSVLVVSAQTTKEILVSIDEVTKEVLISGKCNATDEVTVLVANPSGETDYIDQVVADDNGYYSFKYILDEGENGTYKVTVGGSGFEENQNTTFEYCSSLQNKENDNNKSITVSAIVNDKIGLVKINGNLKSDICSEVSVLIVSPNGSIEYIDQTTAEKNGDFSFAYILDNIQEGEYRVTVGGCGIEKAKSTTLFFISDEQGGFSKIGWAKEEIKMLASKDLINGTYQDAYKPLSNISRSKFLSLLIKTLGIDAKVENNFDDINTNDNYFKEIGIAKKLNITKGVGNNMFYPKENISRQEAMTLIERALKAVDVSLSLPTDEVLEKYSDRDSIDNYAKKSVKTLIKNQIVKGDGIMLNPKSPVTNAEAVAMIYRAYELTE